MMSESEFFAGITGSENDLALAVRALRASGQPFCLIGGLAVNHYAEPVVTLDADFAIAAPPGVAEALRAAGFEVAEHPHSLNATQPGSRLRLQFTVDPRYAQFPARAVPTTLFGVELPVDALADLVQGKLWAAQDETGRASKRLKDKVDLLRLAEAHPAALALIPPGFIPEADALRP